MLTFSMYECVRCHLGGYQLMQHHHPTFFDPTTLCKIFFSPTPLQIKYMPILPIFMLFCSSSYLPPMLDNVSRTHTTSIGTTKFWEPRRDYDLIYEAIVVS